MSSSPYAAALGRFKAVATVALPRETYATLLAAKDLPEVTKLLEPTAYGPELGQAAAQYKGVELLEVAVNRLFVRRNRMALDAAPFAGKSIVAAYLRRWDVQNLGLILSSKAQNRPMTAVETFLVSSRDIPAGLIGGAMTLDDFRGLLQQPTLEAIAAQLVRYGYGAALLPLLEAYARTRDIFPLLQALDRDYYARLLEAVRHFQGDEWVVRQFVQSEIDVKNVLLVLKGKDAGLPLDEVLARFLDGGAFSRAHAGDAYGARALPELVTALEPRFPHLGEGTKRYEEGRSLVGFETVLQRDRAVRELKLLRSYPLSLAILFAAMLVAELERTDLRRIIYAKVYGIPAGSVEETLIVPRL